jgi:hypothetical protein
LHNITLEANPLIHQSIPPSVSSLPAKAEIPSAQPYSQTTPANAAPSTTYTPSNLYSPPLNLSTLSHSIITLSLSAPTLSHSASVMNLTFQLNATAYRIAIAKITPRNQMSLVVIIQ